MESLIVLLTATLLSGNAFALNCRHLQSDEVRTPEQIEQCKIENTVQVKINNAKYLSIVKSYFHSKHMDVKVVDAFEPGNKKQVQVKFVEDYSRGASCSILVEAHLNGAMITYPSSRSSSWGSKGDCLPFFAETLKSAFSFVL